MKTILAADDSVLILQMVKNTLSKNYKVIGVTDGSKALKYLSSHTCDLILLDNEMPELDGVSTFKRIREDPNNAGIPILFLTGSTDETTMNRILAVKPDGYIIKPVPPAELLKRVESVIGS